MHGLNPEGHAVTAERLCLVSLTSYPQVNMGESDPLERDKRSHELYVVRCRDPGLLRQKVMDDAILP